MLINCPRCGFSQPQDQYCAQCGIDMQKFKRKEDPLFIKILGNAGFQVVALLIGTFFVGQYVLTRPAPRKFVQRMIHPVVKLEKVRVAEEETAQTVLSGASASENFSGESESSRPVANSAATARSAAASEPGKVAASVTSATQAVNEALSRSFHITYAEVPADVISQWVNESNSTGLYQSLPEYAVGILNDFKKRNDKFQTLKSADLKIQAGKSASDVSGVMSDDNSQLLGLTVNVELKSFENEILLGSILVNKTSSQGSEGFPSEFELPKGSAFFLIGALKVENFQTDKNKLTGPPFQIFKSQDFMTRKTEFVIILEPVYK
jgi:hypothetical protein